MSARLLVLFLLGVPGLALAGCGRQCPAPLPLTGPQGEVLRCTRPEDCPRPANVLVCTTVPPEVEEEDPCVRCLESRCVTEGVCR